MQQPRGERQQWDISYSFTNSNAQNSIFVQLNTFFEHSEQIKYVQYIQILVNQALNVSKWLYNLVSQFWI